jgi:fibronectin type III domain protein
MSPSTSAHSRVPAVLIAATALAAVLLPYAAPQAQTPSIAFVQGNYAVPPTPRTTVTVRYTGAQTTGNLNVVAIGWNDATSQVLTVADTVGNVYVPALAPTVQPGIQSQVIYYAANIGGAAANTNTVTVTFSAAADYPDVRIAEYQGLDPVTPVDVTKGAYGTGTTSNSGVVTTTYANDLLVGANYVQTVTPGSYSATAPTNGAGWVMQLVAFRAASGGGGDTQAPMAPTGLTATPGSNSTINLAWTASTDDVGVTGYRVERCQGAGCSNFTQVGTSTAPSYGDSGLTASTSYSYRVRATDAATNLSGYSNTASATTLAGGPPSIAFVQSNYAVPPTPQTTVTVRYTGAQTPGNLNVVAIGWNDATSQVVTVTDTVGNVYVRALATVQPGIQSQVIYYAANIGGAAANTNTVTVTFNAAADWPDVRIAEYRGIDPVTPVDIATGAYGTDGMSNSGAVTTTNATDLLVGANYVQTRTLGPGAGYTERLITTPDGNILEDRVVTATGSYSATAPVNGAGWVMQMVAFRGASQ